MKGRQHEIIAIWQGNEESTPLLGDKAHRSLPVTEHIFIYKKRQLATDNTKILHQFNIDFDRQKMLLNGTPCTDRLAFFKYITPFLSQYEQFNTLLLLCQQTIFAYLYRDLTNLIQRYGINAVLADGGEAVAIDIKSVNGRDLVVTAKKQLVLLDIADPEWVVNFVDVEIVSESLYDPEIYAYANFNFRFG